MSNNPKRQNIFHFRQFSVIDEVNPMKIGSDSVLLGALTKIPTKDSCQILDIGTGCGIIALILAQRNGNANITGIEIYDKGAAEAIENVAKSPFSNRIQINNIDANCFNPRHKFDLIVSNPPFFAASLVSPNDLRTAARHEHSLTPKALFRIANGLLETDGLISVVYPTDREADIQFSAALEGFYPQSITRVISIQGKTPKRTIWQFSKQSCAAVADTLVMHNSDGTPTQEYISLVSPYYLRVK